MERRIQVTWFSEMPLQGKVPRSFRNMRTEFAWFVAQDATHVPLINLHSLEDQSIDIGIIIIPKNVEEYAQYDIAKELKRVCKKYAFMQEGPSWYFQSLPLAESLWVYNIMLQADFALAHNDIDRDYYQGLLDKPSFINPTLMIEDSVQNLSSTGRQGVMLGGNLVRWYGGFNSFIVASEASEAITAPQMGRMDKAELQLEEITHLPYLEWVDWIKALSKHKYAVHMNPNTIAGTFNLNCAYLGIPCIGNKESNTQRLCFPELSIDPSDIFTAKKLMRKLVDDQDYYSYISKTAREMYKEHFSEDVYKSTWQSSLEEVL
jgi:hypothetical protein